MSARPLGALAGDLLLDPNAMYARETNANGSTRHARRCQSTFGRRDWQCHRCLELLHGSAPRGSWQSEYAARKLGQLQRWFLW